MLFTAEPSDFRRALQKFIAGWVLYKMTGTVSGMNHKDVRVRGGAK
jgi:hypothetical protein